MSNSDRVVLVLGGAGLVGSGIVKALLDKGFKVSVISRDSSRLERLQSFVSPTTKANLTTIVGNVGSEEGAEQAKQDLLKAVGKVTDIVSSLGFSWWQGGPPHTQSLKDLHWVVETLLYSTFVSWKCFFPLVRDDSNCTYTFITGDSFNPVLLLTARFHAQFQLCMKIDTGVATLERMVPGYLNHLDLGETVATLVERRNSSHAVFYVNCPADLKTILLERNP
uniref:Uncharacterized protein n=1 Tax=Mola mola TaxID=94237 RepID=A0A3Q4B811_MOLML